MRRTGNDMSEFDKKVSFDKTNVKCYNCDEYGHSEKECEKPKNPFSLSSNS